MRTGLTAIGLAVTAMSYAQVEVTRGDYKGWEGITLDNGAVRLTVVPELGRIMHLSMSRGQNVLWENPELIGVEPLPPEQVEAWQNYGGDKLWPAPQTWAWPPDPFLDPGRHTVEVVDGKILMSVQSARSGVRFEREITMHPSQPIVDIVNRLVDLDENHRSALSVWQVAQIANPDRVVMQLPIRYGARELYLYPGTEPDFMANWSEREGRTITLRRATDRSYKVGMGEGVPGLAAYFGSTILVMTCDLPPSAMYPDKDSAWQIYSNPGESSYMELEVASPMRRMRTHEITVRFELRAERVPMR